MREEEITKFVQRRKARAQCLVQYPIYPIQPVYSSMEEYPDA